MAFWLAQSRYGQDSDYIQRFDPRFWTVNFPRPMMSSVTVESPDSIRVDCEFYTEGDLAGLIWSSEDTLSHPLLKYETNRDYSRNTLRFHWKSSGLIPLDEPNGPTLTIEGRDAAGAPATWYVRLWNYATGSPTDADIVLPFSKLEAGFSLPGQPVHVSDIDRMFISFVPVGFVASSSELLQHPITAHAEINQISCEGHLPLLEIGNVILPPHGERMATAYDDAYNQTPTRLIREAVALGYRDTLLHYVGMSHFFQLVNESGTLLVQPGGKLAVSATRWHNSFLNAAKAAGFEVILSLSYEVFAAHCPPEWQQLAFDGEAGRTGWDPPSALLSPANNAAMRWLQRVAMRFTLLQKSAGLPLRFQIGEPWWWITPDAKPCLYDQSAAAQFGGNPPIIESMKQPLDAVQKALLDQAGAVLAQSTIDLAGAVRHIARGEVEVSLLAFTPTILDPEMPELARANVPVGWAWPTFDRLQLEDYDWLTDGADGLRRQAYHSFNERLGYPIDRQDYLSGFVLNPEDAALYWTRIDAGLDEAAERGIIRRYVWAQPQIARDGYTRLPPTQDDTMQAFDDVLYPLPLGRNTGVSPEFSTSVAVTSSGHERRNSLWADARLHFDVGPGIRSEAELKTLIDFFRARRGPAKGFRITDPFDYSSNRMTDTPTALDQPIGQGNGTNATFQLSKSYGDQPEPQIRNITRPRLGSLRIAVDGAEITDWSYQTGGRVLLDSAPPAGATVTAGFLFDVPVRFLEDRLDIVSSHFAAGEAASVPLIEIREDL